MFGAATAIRFLATSVDPGDPVSSVSFLKLSITNTADFTIPTGLPQPQVGDLAVLHDFTLTTTLVVPTGWTQIGSTTITGQRLTMCHKILTASDITVGTNNFTGQPQTCGKILQIFRPNNPVNSVAVFGFQSQSTANAPTNQTLSTSETEGTFLSFAVFAASAPFINRSLGVSPSAGWTFDGTEFGDPGELRAFRKIESGIPSTSYTVSMDDGFLGSGSNSMASFFLRIT